MALVSKSFTFSEGSTIIASEHNSNFDILYSLVNGQLDNANIKTGAAIASTKLNLANIAQGITFTGNNTFAGTTIADLGTVTTASFTSLGFVTSISDGSATIDEFSTDGTMAGNSDTALPTEKAVKTYADSVKVPTQYVPGANSKLFLPCKGIEAGTSIVDFGGSNHTVTVVGTAQLDTGAYKWADSSIIFDGNSDYLTMADSSDWDVFNSVASDLTIAGWVKFADHVDTEVFFEHYEDANNKWRFAHSHGVGLQLDVTSGGGSAVSFSGGEITDSNWHHIMLARVGGGTPDYGLYLDGTQVAHSQDTSTENFVGLLYVGSSGGGANYFQGNMEQMFIDASNYYSASPDAGLTDTITLPTAEELPSSGGDAQSQLTCSSAGSILRWRNI